MALALFSRRSTRERHLQAQNSELRERLQRELTSPVMQDHNVFTGFGDSANAETTLDFLRGSSATAVRVIRQRVQGLERGVFARRFVDGEFQDTQLFDHPLAELMRNPTLGPDGLRSHTAYQLFGIITTLYETLGDAYLFVIRDGMGIPRNLQMARPGTIRPVHGGGVVVGYEQRTGVGSMRLEPQDIVRIWEPDPFTLFTSRSIMGKHRITIETSQFAKEKWHNYYKNDATPLLAAESAVGTDFPTPEAQEEVTRTWAERWHRRRGKWFSAIAFIKPGYTLKQLSNEEAAASGVLMLEHLSDAEFQAFGVSPSISGKNQDVNRAAAETARFTFDQITIDPIAKAIDDAFTSQLAVQYDVGEGVQLVIKTLPFVSRDKAFDLEKDTRDLVNKTRTINQVRSDRVPALDPVTWGDLPVGGFADVPYTGEEEDLDLSALSTVPDESVGVEVEVESGDGEGEGDGEDRAVGEGRGVGRSDNPPGGSMSETQTRARTLNQLRAHFDPKLEWERTIVRDEVFTPRFRAMQRSVFKQQGIETMKRFLALRSRGYRIPERPDAAREAWSRAAADDLAEAIFPLDIWGPLFEATTEVVREESFRASGTEATEAITGEAFQLEDSALKAINRMDLSHIKNVNDTTQNLLKRELSAGLAEGESVDQIGARISKVFGKRRKDATRIARTEIAEAVQTAQVEGFSQTGVVAKKQWNTSLDVVVRDSHIIKGQTRDLDDDFTLTNGARASAPADGSLAAEDRINCRCFTTPVFEGEDALGVL